MCLLLVAFLIASRADAQSDQHSIHKGLGMGFHLNQFQRDFGMGVSLTTPYFLFERVALRARGAVMFHEHVQDSSMTWTPYTNLSLGIVGVSGYVGGSIRLYGEGGVILLFPSGEFSSVDMEFGGYGSFGFEFFPHDAFNYLIELGGIGVGAEADRVPLAPIYSTGFLATVGMRVHLNGGKAPRP